MDMLLWQGMFAPAATPKLVLEKLNAALRLSTAQHSTAQHSTAQHSTAQHSTAQLPSPAY
jgi:hypothetical protein